MSTSATALPGRSERWGFGGHFGAPIKLVAHEKGDAEYVERTHNVSRFCVEHPQIAWVLLIGTLLWGTFGYLSMPQRKDPDIAVRQAVALVPWPGASAERIEQLVTKKI